MIHAYTLYCGLAQVRNFLETGEQQLVNQAHSSEWCTETGNSVTF